MTNNSDLVGVFSISIGNLNFYIVMMLISGINDKSLNAFRTVFARFALLWEFFRLKKLSQYNSFNSFANKFITMKKKSHPPISFPSLINFSTSSLSKVHGHLRLHLIKSFFFFNTGSFPLYKIIIICLYYLCIKNSTTSARVLSAAAIIGLMPFSFRENCASYFNNSLTMSTWPHSAAKWSAVAPQWALTFGSAPSSNRKRTTSKWPWKVEKSHKSNENGF